MRRREFIKVVSVTASALLLPNLGGQEASATPKQDEYSFDPQTSPNQTFAQSVMSGDPRPGSVVLWTRVQTTAAQAVVAYQVSKSRSFNRILAQGTYTTNASMDYTVRIKLTDLEPDTYYFYRFIYNQVVSRTGRTKTAPAPDKTTSLKFGFISCQDYTNGYYAALGAMARENLDFVVHLGDYVYETTGQSFQGNERRVDIPDGRPLPSGGKAAVSLADYRTLYKTYRSDPQLQALHERFATIAIWDDHEFSDDCWDSHSTYFGEPTNLYEPQRRKNSNQVWYEYMPADIPAFDATRPAEQSLQIYRSFQFGKLMDLIMTDERLYRSDHLIPEPPPNQFIGSRYIVPKVAFDALEKALPPLTMLGATQKEWFKNRLANSTATWKFWGNEVSLLRMLFDFTRLGTVNLPPQLLTSFYLDLDQWDGYNRERSELMNFIKLKGIKNVVAVTGDIHAFFAGKVYENYDNQSQPAAMVDLVTAGVTSQSFYQTIYDSTAVPNSSFSVLEPFIRYDPATDTNGLDTILLASNPHIKHARTRANGYSTVMVKAHQIIVSFKEIASLDTPQQPVKRVYTYSVRSGTTDLVAEPGETGTTSTQVEQAEAILS